MKIPDAFVCLELEDARVWVRREAATWAEGTLAGGTTLHAWAGGRPDARALAGRGRVWDVPAPVSGPDGRERWAVRHYRRGGAMAPLLGDRYPAVGPSRPLRELRASEAARARGIPTPAVMAGAVYPAGAFERADLVTELVPGGTDLRAALFDSGVDGAAARDGPDPEAALEATGRLIRLLERRGVYHPDLNAANVLLTSADGTEAWLLDLDRCQVRDEGAPAPMGPMRSRLRRSLGKLARAAGWEGVPRRFLDALTRGLEAEA